MGCSPFDVLIYYLGQSVPARFQTLFHPDKVYLLIGCLGGLGRSLSRWMLSRGARNFVFLGRSGIDRLDARRMVAQLEDAGAKVYVVRGDVADSTAVTSAIKACDATHIPIEGVIQAAMAVGASNFRESKIINIRCHHITWSAH